MVAMGNFSNTSISNSCTNSNNSKSMLEDMMVAAVHLKCPCFVRDYV